MVARERGERKGEERTGRERKGERERGEGGRGKECEIGKWREIERTRGSRREKKNRD